MAHYCIYTANKLLVLILKVYNCNVLLIWTTHKWIKWVKT